MAPVPSSGTVRFSDLQSEFGGSNPIAFSEYYANASAGYANGVAGIPNQGANIRMSDFMGKAKANAPPPSLSAGMLDGMSAVGRASCVGAFSLVRLSSNYTGPVLRVRRALDNQLVDVYASSNGTLGLALDGTGTSLSTWLSNETPFVTNWYDQSGFSNHAFQTSDSLQPYLSMNSNPIAMNFRTTRWFDLPNGTVPIANNPYTVHIWHGAIDNTIGGMLGSGTYGTANAVNAFRRNTATYQAYWWTNNLNAGTYAVGNKLLYTYNGSLRTLRVNGTQVASQGSSGRNSTNINNMIGRTQTQHTNEVLNGDLYYVQIYNTALGSDDLSHVHANSR